MRIAAVLGGGFIILVNGFQWGYGTPDASGAYNTVFATRAEARRAWKLRHGIR